MSKMSFRFVFLAFLMINLNYAYSEDEKVIDIKIKNKDIKNSVLYSNDKNDLENVNKININKIGQIFFRIIDPFTHEGGLYALNIDTNKRTEITDKNIDLSHINYALNWSPDGSKFGIELKEEEEYYKYIWNNKNSSFIKIPVSSSRHEPFLWSNDSSKLAFLVDTDSDKKNNKWRAGIYIVDSDGKNLHILTNKFNSSYLYYSDFQWSQNDNKIIFSLRDNKYRFMVMSSDIKGNITNLSKNINISYNKPKISPNSTKISFISLEGLSAKDGLFLMNNDGSNIVKIVKDIKVLNSCWSPDSSKIIIQTFLPNDKLGLDVYYLKNKKLIKNISNKITEGVTDSMLWSPDSKKIAFYDMSPTNFKTNLYVINIENKKIIKVSKALGILSFDWSPDSKKLVFNSSPKSLDSLSDLYIVDYDGNNLKKITNTKEGESFPTWKPEKIK